MKEPKTPILFIKAPIVRKIAAGRLIRAAALQFSLSVQALEGRIKGLGLRV